MDRASHVLLLLLITGSGCSKHTDPCAQLDRQGPPGAPITLEPIATEQTGAARVPGAPAGCVARFFVRVARAACPSAATTPTDVYKGQLAAGAPPGATCGLSCMGKGDFASFGLVMPDPGFRGDVTCEIPDGGTMTFTVGDPEAGFSDSAGARWLSRIGGDGYALDMCTGTTYVTANACPEGEPTRRAGG